MRTRLVLALSIIPVALVMASASFADPDLGNVPQHRHWIQNSAGNLVQVGPRVCDNPNLQDAFNQFHNNIHVATGSSIGSAAPGLHNFTGGEIRFSGC
jgi:hypothetical protein